MKETQKRKLELIINRPNGETETVDITEKCQESEEAFKKFSFPRFVKATKDAGRGEVVGYIYQEEIFEKEESDNFCKCEKCHSAVVDMRTAYGQVENYRGGKVKAYYCDGCRQLLMTIGAGEFTAMEERAAQKDGTEEYTKSDF